MSTHSPMEQRLTAVEMAVSEIQRRLATLPPSTDWLAQITGSFKDEPAFDEVLAFGKAFRAGDRLPENDREPE